MKLIVLLPLLASVTTSLAAAPTAIFDGKTFDGWEGDTENTWRIEDGCFVAGSLDVEVPHNAFLATTGDYMNFELTLDFKLIGTEGFVNSGVQFRSVRIEDPPHEMLGYQADMGDPSWWGCLYDESRRRKVLAQTDMAELTPALNKEGWNTYRIRAAGPRIQLWINDVQTVDYTEPDETIAAQNGKIALQIHGGAKAVIRFKNIAIEELPTDA